MDAPSTGRLANGHFAPGNAIGKGHGSPYAPQLARLRQALLATATPEAMADVIARLVALCHDEDKRVALHAIGLLLDRVYGKPAEAVSLSVERSGQGEGPSLDAQAVTPEQMAQIEVAVRLLGTLRATQSPQFGAH